MSEQPRQKIPLDGPGPRGAPDCYYTSRVLNSTFHYVRFVRKLRALEEERRKGAENKMKELKDQQYSDFFIKCDRKSLINNVATRVDLCMAAYEENLKKKRERLKQLLSREQEEHIRMFVTQAQEGRDAIWQDKKDRLAYLLAKRKKEHEEKYNELPLSKCVHVHPCIVQKCAKECQQIRLYQMKEKQARREAEKEVENMWYEAAMKESEALKARMEYDAIDRARRDLACHQYSMYQMEQKKIDREKEKERLKQETLYFRSLWDKANKDEEEAERHRAEQRQKTAHDRQQAIDDRHATLAKLAAENQLIQASWDSLANQDRAQTLEKIELIKRKRRDLDECNRKMIELRNDMGTLEVATDVETQEQAAKQQKMIEDKRCEYFTWSQKTNRDVRKAMIDQIHDRQNARETLKEKLAEENEYHRQLFDQLTQLEKHKALTDAQQRKKHQENLLEQIEYSKLLKAQALKEEQDQLKKCQQAAEDYNREIQRMLCRPFFSDQMHPFMKQMTTGLKMPKTCPCSKPTYCAVPPEAPVPDKTA